MRAHQSLEKSIMLEITAGARKKGKRWMDDIKIVTGLSVNDKLISKRQEKWYLLVNNIVKKRKLANI